MPFSRGRAMLCDEYSSGFDHIEPVFGRWSNGGESRCRSLRRTGAMSVATMFCYGRAAVVRTTTFFVERR